MNQRNRGFRFVRGAFESLSPGSGTDHEVRADRAAKVVDTERRLAPSEIQVVMVTADGKTERNTALESLWFQLNDPSFTLTSLVPIPDVTGPEAEAFAYDLARVGAAISGAPVRVVSMLGVLPAAANAAARSIAALDDQPTLVAIDAPTRNPASIPVLRACPRSTLLVGLARSRLPDVEEVVAHLGEDRIIGAVCIERPTRRRWAKR
jgi:hypothetical protein